MWKVSGTCCGRDLQVGQLQCVSLVVVARGLDSCGTQALLLAACGIFPDQGSDPCPLHWQADTYPQ